MKGRLSELILVLGFSVVKLKLPYGKEEVEFESKFIGHLERTCYLTLRKHTVIEMPVFATVEVQTRI